MQFEIVFVRFRQKRFEFAVLFFSEFQASIIPFLSGGARKLKENRTTLPASKDRRSKKIVCSKKNTCFSEAPRL